MHIKGYFMSKNTFVAEVTFKWSRFFIVITFQNKNEMITLFWWLFLPNIFTKPFIKLKKEDISTCIYKLCNENWKYLELKPKLLKAEFFINIMIRFEKKRTKWSLQGDGTEEAAWDLKYQIQDPIIFLNKTQ